MSEHDRDSLVAAVAADLRADLPIDVDLPAGGQLHMERRLPLVCVYRQTPNDAGTELLIADEPAYMIVPSAPQAARQAAKILRVVLQQLTQWFHECLLVEIWSGSLRDHAGYPATLDGNVVPAAQPFEIMLPTNRIPRRTIEVLSQVLGRDVQPYGGTPLVLSPSDEIAAPGTKPLLGARDCLRLNCFAIGIAARPDFRDSRGRVVADRLQRAKRSLHRALDEAAFALTYSRRTPQTPHVHAPGRRSVVKAVLDIDRQLAEIDRSFDLLLQATPVNAEGAWRDFRRSRFDRAPVFCYRPLAIDPALLKRQLYLIPVERIEDPTLAHLFRQKQDELDRQITLLADVDSARFLPESLQIYGGVSRSLLEHAHELLNHVPVRRSDESQGHQLTAVEFAKQAQEELGYYQRLRADFIAKVAVRNDMYAGLLVTGDQLLIGGRTRIPRRRVAALLQHEIGTHLVTRYNGHHQPFRQLEVGLAGYDGFQEGLAVLAEYLVGGLSAFRMRTLAARVVGAHCLVDGATFIDTFRALSCDLGFSQRTAYTIAMRLYRGGGLTKDAVYLRGLLQILRYLLDGGDLEPLFVGKVASSHLPFIGELRAREVIRPPALLPRYLESRSVRRKIERLRDGVNLIDLVN